MNHLNYIHSTVLSGLTEFLSGVSSKTAADIVKGDDPVKVELIVRVAQIIINVQHILT